MKHLSLIAFLLFTSLSFAQSSFNSDSFIVGRNDIETTTFETDSTANALVIYEYGNSYIDKDSYTLKTEIKRKIKILNREGFESATEKIYLYKDNRRKEKVTKIFATTYNVKNGTVIKTDLKPEDIFEEAYNDKYTIIKFTLPNIQEGSVFTYSYLLESPYIYKYYPWNFQDEIPKLYSEYHTSIPGNYEYNIKLVGTQKLDSSDSKIVKNCLSAFNGASADCANTTYIMKNIPAFVAEEYMTTKSNYLSRLEYELKVFRGFDGTIDNITKTWKDADNELQSDGNIGTQLRKSTGLKDEVTSMLSDKNNPLVVAKDIYKYVQDHYVWNGDYKLFNEVSIKNLIKTKSGKVSEINILLHNILEENNIEVKPVLLSTRDNGFITTLYPVISDFNYLIVQATIDGETYLLDATDPYLSFGQLPFRCLNQYGRLLDFKNGSDWISIDAKPSSSIQYRVDLKVNDEMVSGNVKAKYLGYNALDRKKTYFKNQSMYIDQIADHQSEITVSAHDIITQEKNSEEFNETFHVEINDNNTNNELIYINPFIYKFFDHNPFKLQQRTYPIDFGYKQSYLYSVQIDLGGNYEVVEMPKQLNRKLPNNGGDLILTSTVLDEKLVVYFKLNFTEPLYDPIYYGTLKVYIDKVLDIQKNSLVVLKKK